MNIQLNGKRMTLDSHITTIQQLLALYELEQRIVVVEVNEDIVPKDQYAVTTIADDDKIEIVHFVGGG